MAGPGPGSAANSGPSRKQPSASSHNRARLARHVPARSSRARVKEMSIRPTAVTVEQFVVSRCMGKDAEKIILRMHRVSRRRGIESSASAPPGVRAAIVLPRQRNAGRQADTAAVGAMARPKAAQVDASSQLPNRTFTHPCAPCTGATEEPGLRIRKRKFAASGSGPEPFPRPGCSRKSHQHRRSPRKKIRVCRCLPARKAPSWRD